ncbi:hypothetical protein D5086_005015 [Populus alba]|uniref:Uncharacterized protein n=1 Tax=Populus alba TaxID=43335 RepID=A0ACC4CS26_POPAL
MLLLLIMVVAAQVVEISVVIAEKRKVVVGSAKVRLVQAAVAFSEEKKRCDMWSRWRKPLCCCWLEIAHSCWSWCKRLMS